jgi:hypothetical protein
MRLGVFAAALSLACAAFPAAAQPAEPTSAAEAPAPAAPNRPHVAAGTPIYIEVAESLGSKVRKRGDKFALRLVSPITLDGRVIVPAGTTGVGQVVDAAPSGALGKPAKLLVAARYLDLNGAQLPLKGLQLGRAGVDNTNTIMAASFVPYVGLLAMFMHGGEIDIPAGTLGQAKLAADLDVPPAIPVSTSSEQGPR